MIRLLPALALGLAAAACGVPAAPGAAPPGQPLCLGRYALAVPHDARPSANGQTFRSMRVRTDSALPGTTLDRAVALAARPGLGSAGPAVGGARTAVAPDTVLLTRSWVDGIPVTDTAAVRVLPGLVVVAAGQHDGPDGIAAQREAALAIVRAAVPSADPASQEGFCIAGAAIRLPFQWEEAASVGYDLPGSRLSVQIDTNGRATRRRLLGGALGQMAALGAAARTMWARERTLAGHPGEELVIARPDQGEYLLQRLSVGEPVSGTRPRIEIRIEARGVTEADTLLAAWDAMLGSLRRRAGD